MIEILVVIGLLTLVAMTAFLGTDSRDGRDSQARDSWSHGSPRD